MDNKNPMDVCDLLLCHAVTDLEAGFVMEVGDRWYCPVQGGHGWVGTHNFPVSGGASGCTAIACYVNSMTCNIRAS